MGKIKNTDFERCTSGIDFETWNRDLLRSLNFTAERIGKNDSGVDIVAQTKYGDGTKYEYGIICTRSK